ncbi:hypothetical protein AB0904_16385 [Streptomyces sp. NPDC006684]|uniref:hypothetical protein n=1 Tax=Streptomyces sp. NPDC006684 TaxID=3154477 RepID=UPI003455E44A
MTRTATGVLLALAGAVLSGCVSVRETAREPVEPAARASLAVPGALTASTTPLPSPRSRRGSHSAGHREDPAPPQPAPPPPRAAPTRAHTPPAAPPAPPRRAAPHREQREARPPARGNGGGGVCALGRTYGGWPADSPQARICRDAYGG